MKDKSREKKLSVTGQQEDMHFPFTVELHCLSLDKHIVNPLLYFSDFILIST